MRTFLASLRDTGVDETETQVSELLDAGFERLVLEEPLYSLTWDRLRVALPKEVIHAIRLFVPFPREVRPPKRANFRLGSLDAAERRAATAQGIATLEAADSLETHLVIVPPVELTSDALPRGFVDPLTGLLGDGAEAETLAREARRAETEKRLDSYLSSLSAIFDRADRYDVRLALVPTNRPAEFPQLGEIDIVLEEFRGAPLTLWLDTARFPRELVDVPTIGEAANVGPSGPPIELVEGVSVRESRKSPEGTIDGYRPGRGAIDWTLFAGSLLRHETWCADLRFGAPTSETLEVLEFLRAIDESSRASGDEGVLGIP